MKIFPFSIALLSLLFFSFSTATRQEQSILKLALDMEKINTLLLESPVNEAEGVLIVTNGEIPNTLNLQKYGKDVLLVQNRKDIPTDRPHIAIESFRIKESSAVLKFTYSGYHIKLKFIQEEGKWLAQSSRISGNGKFIVESDF